MRSDRIDGHRYEITKVCENDHETRTEEVRFKDTVTA
jgi:hypothetical protein